VSPPVQVIINDEAQLLILCIAVQMTISNTTYEETYLFMLRLAMSQCRHRACGYLVAV